MMMARVRSQCGGLLKRSFGSTTPAAAQYDVCILGGGPGGYVAAIKAGQLGLKAVCVEGRGALGGTCLNVGCIPSKSLLESSKHYHHAKEGMAKHGVMIDNVTLDLDKMHQAKTDSIKGLTQGIEGLLKKNKVDYSQGWGKITGPTEVTVSKEDGSTEVISAKHVVCAMGSKVATLPPVPVDNAGFKVVDSTGALDLPEVPKEMVVVGGGVIGLEMGSVWSRLGSKVTVIEFMPHIGGGLDLEISKSFQRILKKQGFKFKMNSKVTSSSVGADGKVTIKYEPSKGGAEKEITADVVLVSTGRVPNTENCGLEDLGIQMNRGMIDVNADFQTNVPSVYAIGDCIDGPMLAHKAEEEGIACVEKIAGLGGHVNYDCIPGVVYTHPEVAVVGKTEEQLKEEGIAYNKGSFPFKANSRARTVLDDDGMVKILADKESDRVLGIHIIGPNAGEMIAEGCSRWSTALRRRTSAARATRTRH